MNADDYRRYKLPPPWRDRYSLELAPEDSRDAACFLATVTCLSCPEMWDIHIPMGKGAVNVLESHYSNRHAPLTEWSGQIRRKSFRARLERKLDNVLASVSYLPGLGRPASVGGAGLLDLLLEPRHQGGGCGGGDGGQEGVQEPGPVDRREHATKAGRE